MGKTYKDVIIFGIIIPVLLIFYYVIFVTVIYPLWRWGVLGQSGAINMDVLSVVGAVVGFLSVALAIAFQLLSSFSGRRLEGTIKKIDSTLLKNKNLTEHIVHNQDAITKGLVETLGKFAEKTNVGETAMQKKNKSWFKDRSN